MNAALGFITAAAQYGLDSILVKPRRSIGPFTMQVVVEETHHDELEITEHPVELGLSGNIVTDHAYKRPEEVVIRGGWSDSPSYKGLLAAALNSVESTINGVQSLITGNDAAGVKDTYQKFIVFQAKRELMDVYTGKRVYKNMLIKAVTMVTDPDHENSVFLTVTLRQIIVVTTQAITAPVPVGRQQLLPGTTNPPSNMGLKVPVPSTKFNGSLLGP